MEYYLICCGLVSRFFFFSLVQQVHAQPVVTIINISISIPTTAPVPGSILLEGIVCLVAASSLKGKCDEYALVCTVVHE